MAPAGVSVKPSHVHTDGYQSRAPNILVQSQEVAEQEKKKERFLLEQLLVFLLFSNTSSLVGPA